MNHDIDIKKVRINCFRQSKVAGEFMLQLRVPGRFNRGKAFNHGAGNLPEMGQRNLSYGNKTDLKHSGNQV